MDFFGAVPIQHKNQACFMTPQLKSNNFCNNNNPFKDKNSSAISNPTNLVSHLNQQTTNLSVKNLVQKSSSLENQQQQPQLQIQVTTQSQPQQQTNGAFNQTPTTYYECLNNPNSHLINYDPNIQIKQESDLSNESNHSLDQNRIGNGGLNFSNLPFKKNNLSYNLNEINYNQNNQNGLTNLGVNLNYGLNALNGLSSINGLNALNSLNGINGLNGLNNLNNLNNLSNNIKQQVATAAVAVNSKRSSGRRPVNLKDDKLTPEEEERRRVRRERNKQAAARCRKRRVEHTNNLEKETLELENAKHNLELELQRYKQENERVLLILHNHDCKLSNLQNFERGNF